MYHTTKPNRLIENIILKSGESDTLHINTTEIVSLCKGQLRLSIDGGVEQLISGRMMFLIPAGSIIQYYSLEESNVITFRIYDNVEMISYFDIDVLMKNAPQNENKLYTLNHLPSIKWFLNTLVMNVENGLKDESFLHMKYTELFTLLRFYYEPEELAGFLRPMLGKDIAFRMFIYQNASKVQNVKEFAGLYHMTEVGFRKKFHKEMGLSPRDFLMIRKKKMVYDEISHGNKSLKEICNMFGFSNMNYLNTFTNRHFGSSPTGLRKKGSKRDIS